MNACGDVLWTTPTLPSPVFSVASVVKSGFDFAFGVAFVFPTPRAFLRVTSVSPCLRDDISLAFTSAVTCTL